jgi:putative pyruvate formate lyase activating enzyme
MPSYQQLIENKALNNRIEQLEAELDRCEVCPHKCLINRRKGETGICQSGYLPIVSSFTAHFGEEPVISGTNGAGNIFFGNCNLKCVFCQNYQISQNPAKEIEHAVSFEKLADIMLELQNQNCHNIGLVSPSHFGPQILRSIEIAARKGLNIPIVYNSNAYDSVSTLRAFADVADIYLPDFKYGSNELAFKYSGIKNYFESASEAIKEMYRQTGSKLEYENEILQRGLIIRHLVLPNNLAESEKILKFIATELSPEVHVSIMAQYYPTFKSGSIPELNRPINEEEYEKIFDLLEKYGLENGWVQELDSHTCYRPEFELCREDPFSNQQSHAQQKM